MRSFVSVLLRVSAYQGRPCGCASAPTVASSCCSLLAIGVSHVLRRVRISHLPVMMLAMLSSRFMNLPQCLRRLIPPPIELRSRQP